MLETFRKLGIEEDFLNLIKGIYKKPAAVITLMEVSPEVDNAPEFLATLSLLNTSQEILNRH